MTAEIFAEVLKILDNKDLRWTINEEGKVDTVGYMLYSWNDGNRGYYVVSVWIV